MSKVAFIYPGYENLGVEALSAALKSAGHVTRLIFDPILFAESGSVSSDFLGKMFNAQRSMLDALMSFSPDLVCFSVLSDNYRWASQLAAAIKTRRNIPIVFGGIHPSSVPERVILDPGVDFVCVGEGDAAIVELADGIGAGKDCSRIANIWSKSDGQIVRNAVRPPVKDLDALPFGDKEIFYAAAPIFDFGYLISTSRGCPYHCSFCCNSTLKTIYGQFPGSLLRRRSVAHVIEELKIAARRYAPRFIAFVDDTFNFDPAWLREFLTAYRREIALPFSCYLSPVHVTEALVAGLKDAGCFKAQIGVQSIDDAARRRVGRIYNNEQIASIIALFKKHAMFLVCDNIFGLPGQDESEIIALARFYHEHMPGLIEMFWLRYYPGTELTAYAREQRLISSEKYAQIMNGEIAQGIAKGGDHYDKKLAPLQLMLNLFHFLPPPMRTWLLRGGYRYLPAISAVPQLVSVRLLLSWFKKTPCFDMYKVRTFRRYRYFFTRTLIAWARNIMCPLWCRLPGLGQRGRRGVRQEASA